jgi:hypothetical protein
MATNNSCNIPSGTLGKVVQAQGVNTNLDLSVATYPSAVGTAGTQLRSNGTTGWVASTIVWGNTLTQNNILYASSGNTQGQITSANNGVLVTNNTGSGQPSILAGPGVTGKVLQSNASAAPSFSTATYPSTAGTSGNVLTSDGTNWISSAPSSSSTTWNDVSGAFSPIKSNGYFVTATATGTLPASPSQGDTIEFFVDTTQILTIQASGSQIIRFGSAVTAAGGTAVSTARGDSVKLVYRTSGTCWCAIGGVVGTWTLT